MNFDLFLLPLVTSFAISALLLIAIILLGRRCLILDTRISCRHGHSKGVLRFGGLALVVSFVAVVLLDKKLVVSTPLMGVLFASSGILLLGLLDDLKQLSWKIQLFSQFLIVTMVYALGVRLQYITNPFGGIFFFTDGMGFIIGLCISIAWVIFIMNAMNWVDGVDGLAGGITLIGSATIFCLSLRPEVNQPPVAIIAAVLAGSLMAFVFFNFYPAKIMAGTSGSMFMGFMLAILAIFAGAKIATTLLVLAVPIVDALWVIGERFNAGDSIFSSDKRHLHFRLLELGWSVRKICLFYYGITILIGLIALNTNGMSKAIGLLVVFIFLLGMLFAIDRKNSFTKNIN